MTRRSQLPPEFDGTLFRAADAIAAGIPQRRLAAKDLTMLVWGTRAPRGVDSLLARCASYQLRLPANSVFSHVTAARLHGMPLPLSLESRWAIDVSVPRGQRAPDLRGVHGHQLTGIESSVMQFAGLSMTDVARTWCDLAGILNFHDLVAAGDWAVRQGAGRSTFELLGAAFENFASRRGRANLAGAFPLISDLSESPPETHIRVDLVCAGFPRMAVNSPIYHNGVFVARPDLRFVDYPVLIEYEGDYHRTDQKQWRRDLERRARLEALGFTIVQSWADDLVDARALLERTRVALERNGWHPGR